MPPSATMPQVGAPDPEHNTSPIAEETDEDFEVLRMEYPDEPVCFYNGTRYDDGTHVRSGHVILRCDKGLWLRVGTSDPDNP